MRYLCWFLAGIVVILSVLAGWQYHQISSLDSSIAILRVQRDDAEGANKKCAADVDKQNSALAALQLQAQNEHNAAIAALAAAEKLSQKYDDLNTSLDKIKRTGNECKDTFLYIDAYTGVTK